MKGPAATDWYEAEPPLGRAAVLELQRLKRRAKPRWPLILLIAGALTGAVLWKKSKGIQLHDASIVLVVEEGSMASGHTPMPAQELREYIVTVLLSDQVLGELIEKENLYGSLRRTHGMATAIADLRDMFHVGVYRNYFLEQYRAGETRSARISIEYTADDPEFAWYMVNQLTSRIIDGESARRQSVAIELAREAEMALQQVRARSAEVERKIGEHQIAVHEAEVRGERGRAATLRMELADLDADLRREQELIATLAGQTNADQMASAIDLAGLAMRFDVAAEHRPVEEPGAGIYFRAIVGGFLFFMVMPLVAVFVGAFDTRVHDAEDVERLGVSILGHLPDFPGSSVGSLRARGLRSRPPNL